MANPSSSTIPSSTDAGSMDMKCPQCSSPVLCPTGREVCVNGVDVLMLACPDCHNVLGAVNRGYSGYLCS